MNKLFATWQHPADIDLDAGLDAAELLARASRQLAAIPELSDALHLVDVALFEVSDWFEHRGASAVVLRPGRPAAGVPCAAAGVKRQIAPS